MTPSMLLVIAGDAPRRTWFEAVLRRERYELLLAASGREGLRLSYARRPALVVLDRTVGDPDAFQTLDRLRDLSAVPVLMVLPETAGSLPREGEEVRAMLAGADDVLLGKTDATRLTARVRILLRRRTSA